MFVCMIQYELLHQRPLDGRKRVLKIGHALVETCVLKLGKQLVGAF